jgi:hypothetical protein
MRKAIALAVILMSAAAAHAGDKTTVSMTVNNATVVMNKRPTLILTAVLNGEHARMACIEKRGCTTLKPGDYTAMLHGHGKHDPTATVIFDRPIDHRQIKENYRIDGSW